MLAAKLAAILAIHVDALEEEFRGQLGHMIWIDRSLCSQRDIASTLKRIPHIDRFAKVGGLTSVAAALPVNASRQTLEDVNNAYLIAVQQTTGQTLVAATVHPESKLGRSDAINSTVADQLGQLGYRLLM